MRALICNLLLLLSALSASAAVLEVGSGKTYTTLQAAFNAAACGDVILVYNNLTEGDSGATIPTFNSCTQWLTIRSSDANTIPAGTISETTTGVRTVTRSGANNNPVLTGGASVDRVRFHGILFTPPSGQDVFFTCKIGDPIGGTIVQRSQYPDRIIFDQSGCVSRELTTSIQNTGLYANTRSLIIRDSLMRGFSTGNESHGVVMVSGIGPYYFRNNRFEGGMIDVLFGGGGIRHIIDGEHPRSAVVVGNYFHKRPKWLKRTYAGVPPGACMYDADSASYAYDSTNNNTYICNSSFAWTLVGSGNTAPVNTNPKNHYEYKNTLYSLLDGNLLENCWQPASFNQTCSAILVNQVDQRSNAGSGSPTIVGAVFQFNKVKNNADGFVLGTLNGGSSVPVQRLTFRHNVMTRLGYFPTIANDTSVPDLLKTKFFQQHARFPRVSVHNNTALVEGNGSSGTVLGIDGGSLTGPAVQDFTFSSNIVNWANYGLYGYNGGGALWEFGCNFDFNGCAGGTTNTSHFGYNVITNDRSLSIYGNPYPVVNVQMNYLNAVSPSLTNPRACPACVIPAAMTDIGFTSYTTYGATGDLTLAGGSAYKGKAGFGIDPGARVSEVDNSTACIATGCTSGNPFLDFRIQVKRRVTATTATLYVRAPSGNACTTSVVNGGGTVIGTPSLSPSTGNVFRTATITGLSVGIKNIVTVTCDSTTRTEEWFQ